MIVESRPAIVLHEWHRNRPLSTFLLGRNGSGITIDLRGQGFTQRERNARMTTGRHDEDLRGRERRVLPRYRLMKQVDIVVAKGDETYWGSLKDLSRTGIAVALRQDLKASQDVTVRFRMESDDGKVVTEELPATVIWKSREDAGLEFMKPLIAGSSALKKAPFLAAHLDKKS
ncbi:MAG: PilZ domain-containing protein [Nitrospirae bacterium]|nr:MAG: PilZ domain-containing protein [Nitrospirota bacterium]